MDTNLRIPANKKSENQKLLYPELSYQVTGICFSVHNELGPFAREKQYGDALAKKLTESGMAFNREQKVGDSGNIIDFVVENKIAIELKAKGFLLGEDYRQIQNYLQISGLRLGLLVNFRNKYLKPARVVRIVPRMLK